MQMRIATWDASQLYLLHDAMERVRDLSCEEPKDKVHGILSMVDWGKTTPIRLDDARGKLCLVLQNWAEVSPSLVKPPEYPVKGRVALLRDMVDSVMQRPASLEILRTLVNHDAHQCGRQASNAKSMCLFQAQLSAPTEIELGVGIDQISSRAILTDGGEVTVYLPDAAQPGD
ncbi:hypothetical protein K505DRAFT_334047 [Melanomma pulvis-pyrius CBS 109.77]|uniref:Uncharacterized protein n=1 Tax=Melanomma pulvis-pyrius CBS 109.77 TaxID=1314802 RepID=A0A6A6XNP2_9PLEO|nr:hypothetical protein K505DRAFT_334047 [Melanomma pulvis-pyrius CBS 109.77]